MLLSSARAMPDALSASAVTRMSCLVGECGLRNMACSLMRLLRLRRTRPAAGEYITRPRQAFGTQTRLFLRGDWHLARFAVWPLLKDCELFMPSVSACSPTCQIAKACLICPLE